MPAFKHNDVIRRDSYCELVLTNRRGVEVGRAKVDVEDLPRLAPFRWSMDGSGYAYNRRAGGRMHCVIMNAKGGREVIVDHRFGDRLDNRKARLRFASQGQNIHHRPMKVNNKSGAIGVFWLERTGRWVAYIAAHRQRHHVGYFTSFDDAVKARDNKAKELYGDFAYTNAAAA